MKNSYKNNTLKSVSNVQPMPLVDVMHTMYDDAVNAQSALFSAKSSKAICQVLSEIYEYHVDDRLPANIQNTIKDLKGNVRAMHLSDYTRSQMCDDLGELLVKLSIAISAEEERIKHIEAVRSALLVLAEHAEEVTAWFEQKDL